MSEERSIPESWIKGYVDQLIEAGRLVGEDSYLRSVAFQRADFVMDMVRAYRERDKGGSSGDG